MRAIEAADVTPAAGRSTTHKPERSAAAIKVVDRLDYRTSTFGSTSIRRRSRSCGVLEEFKLYEEFYREQSQSGKAIRRTSSSQPESAPA
jgi:hypothetical protein